MSKAKSKPVKELEKMDSYEPVVWLKEIALQLAALNERLESVIRR